MELVLRWSVGLVVFIRKNGYEGVVGNYTQAWYLHPGVEVDPFY